MRRKKVYILCTVAFLLFLFGAALIMLQGAADRRQQIWLEEAQEFYSQGEYEGALLKLRQITDPELRQEASLIMADCYEAIGNYRKAIDVLRGISAADSAVATRIRSLEGKQELGAWSPDITVAGIELEGNAKEVRLDGKGLTDEVLKELSPLYALEGLYLGDNKLRDIRMISCFGGLDILDLSGNRIEDISSLAELRELRYLDLSRNPVSDFSPLYGISGLNTLRIIGTRVSEEELERLAEALPACIIRSDLNGVEEIRLGSIRFQTDVETLNLDGRGIRDAAVIGECTKLISLSLCDNEISDLQPLMNLPELKTLKISGNAIHDLRPLIGLPKLNVLDVSDNLITDVSSLSAISQLTQLTLDGNDIADFSGLGRLERIEVLNLERTGIEDSDLDGLETAKTLLILNLQNNPGLSDRAVGKLNMVLNRCNIMCTDLVYEINFAGHTVLSNEKKLAFPSGELETLSGLENLTELEELDLSGNRISNLSPFAVSPARDTLRRLNLMNNRIADVSPLWDYHVLEDLNLSGNKIEGTEVLQQMSSLKRLDLSGNPLTQEQVDALRSKLPNCIVVF